MLRSRSDRDPISRRYGVTAASEWQRFLYHFEYAEGFELLVLVVPDADGAKLCRLELERVLGEDGKRLLKQEGETPDQFRAQAAGLPQQPMEPSVGACWLAGVAPRSAADFAEWKAAWRRALEGLNQQRNPLRRRLPSPLVVVAAPWVIPLFRDVAPDLWSVRSQVVHIEPDRERMHDGIEDRSRAPIDAPSRIQTFAPDPDLAHREVERLRGIPGRERELGTMLIREGEGLLGGGDLPQAEAAFREAVNAFADAGDKVGGAEAAGWLGRALLDQGRAAEAEAAFRHALELAEEGGDTAVSRSVAIHGLGVAILNQGRATEAEAAFRHALVLKEQGGDTAVSRGITMHELGRALLDQGRAAEAEAAFRRALTLKDEGSDAAVSRSVTIHGLGVTILNQGRAAEAEAAFRRALELAEEGDNTGASRGITIDMLGRALLDQGRAAEAEAAFRHALELAEEGGDTAVSRSVAIHGLGVAILNQGRAAEAEAVFRRALELAKEGDSAEGLRVVSASLARAVREQGRVEEADAILRGTDASSERMLPTASSAN